MPGKAWHGMPGCVSTTVAHLSLETNVPMWHILGMDLRRYIKMTNKTATDFAKEIGVSHSTVVRYMQGLRVPNSLTMQRIVKATNGAVTPDDFFRGSLATVNRDEAAA
jgi:transcriptional regulator with XRE-family HTH domain